MSICQLHILLSRTAQISLELHFCAELQTKKSPATLRTVLLAGQYNIGFNNNIVQFLGLVLSVQEFNTEIRFKIADPGRR